MLEQSIIRARVRVITDRSPMHQLFYSEVSRPFWALLRLLMYILIRLPWRALIIPLGALIRPVRTSCVLPLKAGSESLQVLSEAAVHILYRSY